MGANPTRTRQRPRYLYAMLLRPEYLSQKLDRPQRTHHHKVIEMPDVSLVDVTLMGEDVSGTLKRVECIRVVIKLREHYIAVDKAGTRRSPARRAVKSPGFLKS